MKTGKAKEHIDKCLTIMGENIVKFGYKHDGSRIVQACLRYGTKEQIAQVKKACKEEFYKLMMNIYGRHLAVRLYDDAFDEAEKKAVQENVCSNMEKYVVHAYGSELVEHIYTKAKAELKNKMFEAVFGNKLKFIKETEAPVVDVNKVLTEHPMVKEHVDRHLEELVETFVDKGLIRLTFVQRIFLFFVKSATQNQLNKLLETVSENYLALLGSREGLYAASILFTAANPKVRKQMIKQLKTENENLVDNMVTNNLGIVFLMKVLTITDDTKLSCKLVLDRVLEIIDTIADNASTMRFLSGLTTENIKRYYASDDQEILSYDKFSTSKKEPALRLSEVLSHLMQYLPERMEALIPAHLAEPGFCKFLTELMSHLVRGHVNDHTKMIIDMFLKAFEVEGVAKPFAALPSMIIKTVVEEELKFWEGKPEPKYVFTEAVCPLLKKDVPAFAATKSVFVICKLLKKDKLRELVFGIETDLPIDSQGGDGEQDGAGRVGQEERAQQGSGGGVPIHQGPLEVDITYAYWCDSSRLSLSALNSMVRSLESSTPLRNSAVTCSIIFQELWRVALPELDRLVPRPHVEVLEHVDQLHGEVYPVDVSHLVQTLSLVHIVQVIALDVGLGRPLGVHHVSVDHQTFIAAVKGGLEEDAALVEIGDGEADVLAETNSDCGRRGGAGVDGTSVGGAQVPLDGVVEVRLPEPLLQHAVSQEP